MTYGGLGLGTLLMSFMNPMLKVRGVTPSIHILSAAVGALPWLIGAALLLLALLKKRWVPLLAFVGSQVLGLAAILALLFGAPIVEDYASRTSFESAGWKAENRSEAEGTRVQMVDDLFRHHRLVGMNRAQLEALLGVPPSTPHFSEYDYVYWLGPECGLFSIGSEWLVVKLQNDTVVTAKVVTD